MFPKFLVFIRHAESEKNRIMRQLDQDLSNTELAAMLNAKSDHEWPITPEGKQRAEWVGRFFPLLFDFERGLPKLYTSTHLRAIQTSLALSSTWERPSCLWQKSDQDLEWPRWTLDSNLCERAWGTEMSWGQFKMQYPKEYQRFEKDPFHFRPNFPGGESFSDVRNSRAERFLRRIDRECTNQDTVFVLSHLDHMLSCRSLLEELDPFQFKTMHGDPTQRINNLDVLCYSCVHMNEQEGAISPHPVSVALIKFPFEGTSEDDVAPIEWKKIEHHTYSREELLQLTAD